MQITKDELTRCKRAVLVLNDLAKLALELANTAEPIEVQQDRVVLLQVLKRLERIAQ